jgi:hypothetical protein
MHHTSPLPIGTQVAFDIAQGMATGRGVVIAAEYDDGWAYRLDAPPSTSTAGTTASCGSATSKSAPPRSGATAADKRPCLGRLLVMDHPLS